MLKCPHCQNEDRRMISVLGYTTDGGIIILCEVCSKESKVKEEK